MFKFLKNIFNKKEICSVWREYSKIDYNFFDGRKTSQIDLEDFKNKVLNLEGKIAINAGHYIPDSKNWNNIGKNPLKTWEIACGLASELLKNGKEVYISMLINDLSLSTKDRTKMSYKLAEPFVSILKKYGLSESNVIYDLANKNSVYAEKRMANRVDYNLRRTKKMENYDKKDLNNYCKEAIVGYLQDIKKQDINNSVWIIPKCSHGNLIQAISIFDKAEGGLNNFIYFETLNCFL